MTRDDFTSETWARLVEHVSARMTELREANDNPRAGERQTTFIRGQIVALKDILALQPAAPQDDASPDEALTNRSHEQSWN